MIMSSYNSASDMVVVIIFQGCYGAGRDFIMDFTGALIGMGIGACVVVVSC